MKILSKEDIEKEHFVLDVLKGAVFIYPTDTIYGIGCDATNDESVKRIREIKGRDSKQFSVIAPSSKWIDDNCVVPFSGAEWLAKLPGPYTLILKLKNNNCVAPSVNPAGETLGVRIPRHWISDVATKIGKPLVTTSVNISGQPFAVSVQEITPTILEQVDFIIDEGKKDGRPSTMVDLTGEEAVVKQR
jgi:L-threonylcarbamoyladenylate synthase